MKKIIPAFIVCVGAFGFSGLANAVSCGLKETTIVVGHDDGSPQKEVVRMRGKGWLSEPGQNGSWQQVTIQLCLGDECDNKRIDRQMAQATSAYAMEKFIWMYMRGLNSCNDLLNYSPDYEVVQLEICDL